jgi:hypothetical protein
LFRFRLNEGDRPERINVKASRPGGFLLITVHGFEGTDADRILQSFRMTGGDSFVDAHRMWDLRSDGTLEGLVATPPLRGEAGVCMVELSVDNYIAASKLTVRPDQVTEWKVHHGDFLLQESLVPLTGILFDGHGLPVANAELRFTPPPSLAWKNYAGFRCTTDETGRFSLKGPLKPGSFDILVITSQKEELRIRGSIPDQHVGPYHLELFLPGP